MENKVNKEKLTKMRIVKRVYHKSWEDEFKWLTLKNNECFCNVCHCPINVFKKYNISKHGTTQRHIKNERALSSNKMEIISKPNVKYVINKKDDEHFEALDNENELENPVLVEIMSNTDDAIKPPRSFTHTKRRTPEVKLVSPRTMVQNTPQKNQELEPEDHLGGWIATNLKALKRDPELYLSTEMNLFATMIKALAQLNKRDADSNEKDDPSSEGDILLESLNAAENIFSS